LSSIWEWLSESTDAFVARYSPAARAQQARRQALAARPGRPKAPTPLPTQPVAKIGGSTHQPQPKDNHHMNEPTNTGGLTKANFLRTLMSARDSNQKITWNGGTATIGEVIRELIRDDDGAATVQRATQQQQAGGPGVMPSRAAVDALSDDHYRELKETGNIGQLMGPPPVRVSVRQGGAIERRYSFNPDTGAVEDGRPLDIVGRGSFNAPPGYRGGHNKDTL